MGIASKPLASLPNDEQSFSELLDRHKRNIGIAVAVVIIGLGGAWFYTRTNAIKEQRAEKALRGAMQSVFSGNSALAQSDLKKVVVRYDGTTAGSEAALQLAQLYYNDGKFKEGIEFLKKAKPTSDMAYDVQIMIGAGYDGLNQGDEAAKAYQEAIQKARFNSDRDVAKSNAARAYMSAGKGAEAIKLWTELANDPKSTMGAEARVRLGEAQAKPIKV
jgi:predicted negative regulator of RcsB-dependent stress response